MNHDMMNCVEMNYGEMNAYKMMYEEPNHNEVGYYIGSSEMSEGEYSDDEMSVCSIKYCDKTDTNTDMDTNTIYVNNLDKEQIILIKQIIQSLSSTTITTDDKVNNDTCIIQIEA